MSFRLFVFFAMICISLAACRLMDRDPRDFAFHFPDELVHFVPDSQAVLFTGEGEGHWDKHIRERGWILRLDSGYCMWYTGYINEDSEKHLGYATSPDGYSWTRYPGNPVHSTGWVEDMCVVQDKGLYYMFAEGRGDTAHLLSSPDRLHWTELGPLNIRKTRGEPIDPGSFGTPAVIKVDSLWYLFYERNDLGIWLAKSSDLKNWTNVRNRPVISLGPDAYDLYGVAMDQVIQYEGHYYGYYHATAFKDWHEWTTNVAVSSDLIHWTKYPGNPILRQNKSSAILVNDGRRYRLYSMHDSVKLHFPFADSLR